MAEAVVNEQMTRVLLWRGMPASIVGIPHVRDLLRALATSAAIPTKVMALARPPWLVLERSLPVPAAEERDRVKTLAGYGVPHERMATMVRPVTVILLWGRCNPRSPRSWLPSR